jgi:FixJ family two-component response regulator
VEKSLAIDVVNGDDALRASLRALLESYGFVVSDYRTGIEFLKNCADSRSACLLLGAQRPAEGLDTVSRLRRDMRSDIPVVMITGRSSPELDRRAFAAGATVLLDMPLEGEKLIETVKSVIAANGLASLTQHSHT